MGYPAGPHPLGWVFKGELLGDFAGGLTITVEDDLDKGTGMMLIDTTSCYLVRIRRLSTVLHKGVKDCRRMGFDEYMNLLPCRHAVNLDYLFSVSLSTTPTRSHLNMGVMRRSGDWSFSTPVLGNEVTGVVRGGVLFELSCVRSPHSDRCFMRDPLTAAW